MVDIMVLRRKMKRKSGGQGPPKESSAKMVRQGESMSGVAVAGS